MRSSSWLALALCLCTLVVCTPRSPAEGKPAAQLAYLERVTGGAAASAKLPLVVAIHGLGDSPEHFLALFDDFDAKARIVAPRAPDPWHGGGSWYPFRAPLDRQLPVIRARADLLAAWIAELSRARPSVGRTIVTGFSQGGVMSFALAAYHPELLEAALPVAGELDPALPDPVPLHSPLEVHAFHGLADPLIAHGADEATVERLRKAGRAVTLTSYQGLDHHISLELRRDLFGALRSAVGRAAHR
jgi:phospholipase/carboxylesterase